MLVLKLASPRYVPVTFVWLPVDSAAVVKVVCPLDSVLVPSVVAPSLKTTEPVGVPTPGETALTVAVNVTDAPNTDGLKDDARAVVVLALFTVCVTAAEVLPL